MPRERPGPDPLHEALLALVEVAPGHKVRCFIHSDAEEEAVEVAVEVGRR